MGKDHMSKDMEKTLVSYNSTFFRISTRENWGEKYP